MTGGLRLALGEAPQHERAWSRGAEGERLVAASLEARCGYEVLFLHDRRIPGSRANIDHIAIAPSGVSVIDAKNYRGRARVRRRLFGEDELWIEGRKQTKLLDGLDRQTALVREALERAGEPAPVHGAFCFIDTDLPLLRTLEIRGYPLLWRKAMAKRLQEKGPLEHA